MREASSQLLQVLTRKPSREISTLSREKEKESMDEENRLIEAVVEKERAADPKRVPRVEKEKRGRGVDSQ